MYFKKQFFALLIPILFSIGAFLHPTPVSALTTISTCAELQDISLDLAEDYELSGNIDCTGFTFTPLGTFTGTLDGNDFAIDQLTITGMTNDHALFADTDGATIKHLSLTNASMQGNYQGGLLIAVAVDTDILDVSVQGTYFSGATLSLLGGMVGRMSGGSIIHGSADVALSGYEFVGGLVASATDDAEIKKSFATGTITTILTSGNASNGGLVAELIDSSISNSYTDVAISANGDRVGGLVGTSEGDSLVLNSYAVGSVASTGTLHIGGLVGRQIDDASVVDSYWDTQTTGQIVSADGEGKITNQMQDEDTFDNWDFTHIWDAHHNDYPTFVPYDPALPVLTEVQQIPSRVTAGNARYYFSASEDGDYQFTYCGATTSIDTGRNIAYITDTTVGGTYGNCAFQMIDDDGNVSNQLTIDEFTVIRTPRNSSQTRSRAFFGYLMGKPHTPAGKEGEFGRTLRTGSVGEDVRSLQVFLNTQGFPVAQTGRGSLGNETIFFGPKTQQALIAFQEAHASEILTPYGLTKGTGIFGESTRTLVTALLHK